jgi:hypothetical protein
MESSAFLRDKAEQCRRLARSIMVPDDPAVTALLNMAAEFEAKAAALENREDDPEDAPGRASK